MLKGLESHRPPPPSRRYRRLTDNEIDQARKMFAAGSMTQQQIARHFGVTDSAICRLRRRMGWSWVRPPRKKRAPVANYRDRNPVLVERIRTIKRHLAAGLKPLVIARQMGVSKDMVYRIRSGKFWSRISID